MEILNLKVFNYLHKKAYDNIDVLHILWQAKKDFDAAVQAFKKRREAVDAAARQVAVRGRLEGRWASKYQSKDGKIDVILDGDGNPTKVYPHIHVAHNARENHVAVIVSLGPRNHPDEEILPIGASGNEVNAAIERALQKLRRY